MSLSRKERRRSRGKEGFQPSAKYKTGPDTVNFMTISKKNIALHTILTSFIISVMISEGFDESSAKMPIFKKTTNEMNFENALPSTIVALRRFIKN